jgi:hypothetical protein
MKPSSSDLQAEGARLFALEQSKRSLNSGSPSKNSSFAGFP